MSVDCLCIEVGVPLPFSPHSVLCVLPCPGLGWLPHPKFQLLSQVGPWDCPVSTDWVFWLSGSHIYQMSPCFPSKQASVTQKPGGWWSLPTLTVRDSGLLSTGYIVNVFPASSGFTRWFFCKSFCRTDIGRFKIRLTILSHLPRILVWFCIIWNVSLKQQILVF